MSDLKPTSDEDVEGYAREILMKNVRWAQRMNQTFPEYFPDPRVKQAPKVLWLGCSDSRVQESDAMVTLPGTAFVHRNIANQFHPHDDNAVSVLAYAVKELAVQHIIVVGHEYCGGALTAMIEARRSRLEPDQVKRHHTLRDSLYHIVELVQGHHLNEIHDEDSNNPNDAITRWLTPLVNRLREIDLPPDDEEALRFVVEENVRFQVENLTQPHLDAYVKKSAKERPVWVHGWVYDFSTGFIRDLHITKVLGADHH